MSNFDLSKEYNQYAKDVVDNHIITCKWIKLACERYISWFDRDDIYFDEEDVDRKIRFVSKMKHSTGEFFDKPFILYDWQQWIFASIFGFKYVETGYRVIKNVLLFISRKNGKSSLASALGIVGLICDNEPGAEIACVANSTRQATLLFDKMNSYIKSIDPKEKIFRRYRHIIKVPATNSQVIVHSADPKALDGFNTSVAIVDEYHSAKDSKVYDLMKNSQGMRKQPLMIVITTAGFNVGEEFPLYSMYEMCTEILTGAKKDDSQFAALYTLDEGDDWRDKINWTKCSPGYPDIVDRTFMDEQLTNAINNPLEEVEFKTKLMNVWCTSSQTWIPNEDILKYTINFNDMKFTNDYCCYCGVDLSTVSDLTAVSYVVGKDDACYFKTDYYLPRGGVEKSKNKELYKKWEKDGYLTITDGERINYDYVVSDIKKQNEKIPILEIYYDKYNAQAFKQQCEDEGLVMTAFSQTMGSFNAPTKDFERNLYLGKIFIDNNPITRWCFKNVELKMDANENVKPFKGAGANNKIDGVIAMIQAYAGYLKTFIYGQISTI